MSDRDAAIVEYFLGLCSLDDPEAEGKTCEKFNIDDRSLMIILEADLVESMTMFDNLIL